MSRRAHPSSPERAPAGAGRAWTCALIASAALQLAARRCPALEPRSLTEPDVLREPAQVTQVVDAFDAKGAFDLHFTLSYQQRWKRARVSRETQSPLVDAGAAYGIARAAIGDYAENTSRLNVRADIGVFRDLALIVRVPIILSRSAELVGGPLPAPVLDGAPGEPLFAVPFRSPNRSGVEYLSVGVDWGLLNQWRDAVQPTLLIGAEARFSVTEAMNACASSVSASEGTVRCAHPGDIDRDGQGGEFPTEVAPGRVVPLEGEFASTPRKAGVSRGTTGLSLHALLSRRLQLSEPYVGFHVLYELPHADGLWQADEPWGTAPPVRGGFSMGAEVVPWEVVEQFQRLSVDLRFTGTYVGEGHDYSELFDALGSASGSSYRRPNFARYMPNPDPATAAEFPSVIDPDAQRVFPTGLTRVQAHGAYNFRVAARWQAGPYVHFDLGGAVELTQRHFISYGQPCDDARDADVERAGPCTVEASGETVVLGAPDPSFRPEVDLPGRRFVVDAVRSIDAWVGATVMF